MRKDCKLHSYVNFCIIGTDRCFRTMDNAANGQAVVVLPSDTINLNQTSQPLQPSSSLNAITNTFSETPVTFKTVWPPSMDSPIPRLGSLGYTMEQQPELAAPLVRTLSGDERAERARSTVRREEACRQVLNAALRGSPEAQQHELRYFPLWRGLARSGKCAMCGRRRWREYCARCFLCEGCATDSTCGATGGWFGVD